MRHPDYPIGMGRASWCASTRWVKQGELREKHYLPRRTGCCRTRRAFVLRAEISDSTRLGAWQKSSQEGARCSKTARGTNPPAAVVGEGVVRQPISQRKSRVLRGIEFIRLAVCANGISDPPVGERGVSQLCTELLVLGFVLITDRNPALHEASHGWNTDAIKSSDGIAGKLSGRVPEVLVKAAVVHFGLNPPSRVHRSKSSRKSVENVAFAEAHTHCQNTMTVGDADWSLMNR